MNTYFPTDKPSYFLLCENFAEKLLKDSNGQIRRKASWLGARLASSLPNQAPGFNINTLLDGLTQCEDPVRLSSLVDKAQVQYQNWRESILERVQSMTGPYSHLYYVEQCSESLVYDVFKRAEQSVEADFSDYDDVPMGGHENALEAHLHALSLLVEEGVITAENTTKPTTQDIFQVTYHVEGDGARTVNVSVSCDESNISDAIEAKLEAYLKEELGEDDIVFYIDGWTQASLVVCL
ncbi:hypothetical protein AB6D11_00675 [Vibrio splendidus]